MQKKLFTLAMIALSISLCSLAFPGDPGFKNLKVLSKNTTHEELEVIMKGFNAALGVKCGFCHAKRKDDPKKLDFASDENQHKSVARNMMRMTMKINKKFFRDETADAITCFTCHQGKEEPRTAPKIEIEE